MNREEINTLIQERNEWCVSIIIPTHRTAPDRRIDVDVLSKSIQYAKTILRGKSAPPDIYEHISDELDHLYHEFDAVHALDGVGLFVSPRTSKMVYFPFTVNEKVIVDVSFEVRDLYYLNQFSKPYYILKLTKNEANLYEMEGGVFTHEITNAYFPMRNTQDYDYAKSSLGAATGKGYEYAKSTLGTSYGFTRKGYEKDKSQMTKIRQESFYREVAVHVKPYTKLGDLLISGSRNILSIFDASHDKHLKIKGRITGSFKSRNDLFKGAANTYFDCKQNEIQMLVDSLSELIGKKGAVYGIRNVWSAISSGKGETLLVEKDFKDEGLTLPEGKSISIHELTANESIKMDKVDEVISAMLAKGGKVIFVEENQLLNYDKIALILRSPI